MREQDKNNYFFLNRQGRWPGFQWHGLERDDHGVLRLSSLPLFSGTLPDSVKSASGPSGPAGLAIDRLGSIYFSDPDDNRVSRVEGCDGSSGPLPCIGGNGSGFGQFSAPRGLLIPTGRNVLFVADTGNHRVQVFDLNTMQLVEVWGQANVGGTPKPGSQPGEFNLPWTLTSDSQGNFYVVDYGNQRVQKFNSIGEVDPAFWAKMQASSLLHQPADIALRDQDGKCWIFVLDASSATIFVFDEDGNPILDSQGKPRTVTSPELQQPMGLAVDGNALYVGDNGRRRVFRFQLGETISLVGEAIGYEGPVAALLLDGKGGLMVHPGGSAQPVLMQARAGCATQGVLWGGPIQVDGTKVVWHRLQSLVDSLSAHAHLDLFAYASSKNNDEPAVQPLSQNPFADKRWNSAAYPRNADIADIYIGSKEAKYLWVGALFFSDGSATPALRQLRVEFDYPSYEQYLPALYSEPSDCREFLARLLSLFESFNEEVEDEIASIPALFDPEATPKRFLPWLAACLGLDLDENWDEQKQRRIIAEIFRLSGRRGTPAGLRESLRIFAGVDAVIEEPILHAAWWALPAAAGSCCSTCAAQANAEGENWDNTGNSILGWTTMLAPAQPQGAVVGTSADLNQSHLITNDDFGSPLFTDVAHRFTLNLYRGQVMCEGAIPRIRAVVDQEKPAHTAYQVCIIEPRFRVGFQSRVGIDTVVAGPQRSLALGSTQALGEQTVLAGEAVSYMGGEARLGVTTRLT